MVKKIVVEVGSTVTKVDMYDGERVKRIDEKTIQFKKDYNADKKLRESDIKELIELVNKTKEKSNDIYVCGTSIFRNLNNEEKENFFNVFKNKTGLEFNIISQEKENELTVKGCTRFTKGKVCVFVGGGGSTEITVYDNGIRENVNSKVGVIDVMEKFRRFSR